MARCSDSSNTASSGSSNSGSESVPSAAGRRLLVTPRYDLQQQVRCVSATCQRNKTRDRSRNNANFTGSPGLVRQSMIVVCPCVRLSVCQYGCNVHEREPGYGFIGVKVVHHGRTGRFVMYSVGRYGRAEFARKIDSAWSGQVSTVSSHALDDLFSVSRKNFCSHRVSEMFHHRALKS